MSLSSSASLIGSPRLDFLGSDITAPPYSYALVYASKICKSIGRETFFDRPIHLTSMSPPAAMVALVIGDAKF
jgi:hypothetical protein